MGKSSAVGSSDLDLFGRVMGDGSCLSSANDNARRLGQDWRMLHAVIKPPAAICAGLARLSPFIPAAPAQSACPLEGRRRRRVARDCRRSDEARRSDGEALGADQRDVQENLLTHERHAQPCSAQLNPPITSTDRASGRDSCPTRRNRWRSEVASS